MSRYEARVIGETSGGMTALEIYKDGELYWSHDYFSGGATDSWYKKGLRQIFDDAVNCGSVEEWAEWDYDDDSEKVIDDYDTEPTTWIVAIYRPESGWEFSDPRNDGQSKDFIKYNADRIPSDVVEKWEAGE